jgi:putative redox protein
MAITAKLLKNYQVELTNGRHTYFADEPESLGGEDTAPNPYDYLLGGLAACKIITLQMYAQRKGWQIDGITMALSHEKVDAATVAESTTASGKIDVINVDLSFEGNLDADQIERLKQISDKCPVQRTITNELIVRSRLTQPA